ncbi:hypothetical protein ITJ86_06795 [Winogradskyella sp. F6397]|uniref:Uncharacterized protein n=1 Tax=Winogradskyella marina TaxID=2785530 RepID=A0ABS0EGM8_9FLAO|nr:hypothetical protein [Winogradskyella marina]MBF8149599.1 hypothetical protein [Winogradskyella marina]
MLLVLAVLFPSAVKLNHAFSHHTHNVCDDDGSLTTHFHEADIDCDFYKFKLTTQFYFKNKLDTLVSEEENFKITNSQYEFVSDFQKLQTVLRGPPQLI